MLPFTFFLVEYGMQHTQLVPVLEAERGAEREAGHGAIGAWSVEPRPHAAPP